MNKIYCLLASTLFVLVLLIGMNSAYAAGGKYHQYKDMEREDENVYMPGDPCPWKRELVFDQYLYKRYCMIKQYTGPYTGPEWTFNILKWHNMKLIDAKTYDNAINYLLQKHVIKIK